MRLAAVSIWSNLPSRMTAMRSDSAIPEDTGGKPFAPLVTFIGIGVTAAVGGATIGSLIDRNSKVAAFERAAKESNACQADASGCDTTTRDELRQDALDSRERAKSADTRTLILGIATGVVAVGTAAIAVFLTDWGGDGDAESAGLRFDLAASPDASMGTVTVRW